MEKGKSKKVSREKCDDRLHQAHEKLQKAHQELRDSHVEMIFRLALMAEFRDPVTGTHLVRVADYSSAIAEGYGLSPEEIEIIRFASPMHDVGKIILSDQILKKKGKLDSGEVKDMRRHTETGFEIFREAKSPVLKACGVIALTHHERFDGTGYPNKLKGDQIHLYGRIVALADCFDAYTSKRPYKEAIDFEESASMVMERAGTHFDPAVVMAFAKNKDKIKKIWEANQDIEDFLKEMEMVKKKID